MDGKNPGSAPSTNAEVLQLLPEALDLADTTKARRNAGTVTDVNDLPSLQYMR